MKKITIALLSVVLYMSTALAESITIIPGGKPGGSFNARATLYKDILEKKGFEINFENITNAREGVKYLQNSKDTVIQMFAVNQPSQIGYDITKDNFVLVEYMTPYYWCQSNASMNNDELKVGLVKNMNTTFSDQLFAKLGKKVVYLRYKNSGTLYNAFTAGDVDVQFTSQSRSFKVIKNNQGKCIANTYKQTVEQIPSVYDIVNTKTVFPGDASIVISNNASKKLRNILLEANKDADFIAWKKKRGVPDNSGKNSWKAELAIVDSLQQSWKSK